MNNLSSETKTPRQSQITISIVTICDIRVLVEKIDDKWAFPSDIFLPMKETTQQTASRILFNAIDEDVDTKKWIPVDIRSHPKRIDHKSKLFTVDIGYTTILELADVPPVDNSRFSWVLVDFESGKFPVPLIEDHDQLWEASFGVFNILLKS